jgi:hypothetical protein
MHSRKIDEGEIKTQVEANDEEGYRKKFQKTPGKTCPGKNAQKLPNGEDRVVRIIRVSNPARLYQRESAVHRTRSGRWCGDPKAKVRYHASVASREDKTILLIRRLMIFVATFAGSTRCPRLRPECRPPKTRRRGSLHQPKGFCLRRPQMTKSQWSTHRRYPCRSWPGGSHPRPSR